MTCPRCSTDKAGYLMFLVVEGINWCPHCRLVAITRKAAQVIWIVEEVKDA